MASKYAILSEQRHRELYSRHMGEISPFDAGIPLLDIGDETIQEIYYFRWHTYCQQIKETPLGYVVTEFLPPVPWAGIYNTINCPAGHHFYEGRWLHNRQYLKDYAAFWFTPEAEPRKYSFWAADAISAACRVWGDTETADRLYPKLKENYAAWEKSHGRDCGLFFQIDNYDGMEYSIGGSGLRPTINSYMYADAIALSQSAARLGLTADADEFTQKAAALKEKINAILWDPAAEFYKTCAETGDHSPVDVRELVGYIPWCWNIPEEAMGSAWKFLNDPNYFAAPYGPTTAERNHPDFMKEFDHECLWNGPSWPFATTQTLTALGNLLCNYAQDVMTEADYFDLLKTYANSHYITDENGERAPFIDENIEPFTGEWLARSILKKIEPPRKDVDRGRDYNHSAFCDLVISGLAGIRVSDGDRLEIHPLFAEEQMDYFCADGVLYRGHDLTVLWDKTGERYHRGSGLQVFLDGELVASSAALKKVEISIPSAK